MSLKKLGAESRGILDLARSGLGRGVKVGQGRARRDVVKTRQLRIKRPKGRRGQTPRCGCKGERMTNRPAMEGEKRQKGKEKFEVKEEGSASGNLSSIRHLGKVSREALDIRRTGKLSQRSSSGDRNPEGRPSLLSDWGRNRNSIRPLKGTKDAKDINW